MQTDGNERYNETKKVILVTLLLNLFIFAIKLTAVVFSDGKAIAAECCHTFADMGMTLAVLIAVRMSKGDDKNAKLIENRIAKALSAVLFITAMGIGIGGLTALINGSSDIPGRSAVFAIAVSAAVKEKMYRYTLKTAEKLSSTALTADAWHHRSDALSSLASLAGVIGARLGLYFLDPIAAITVCGMIIKAAKDIYIAADVCEDKNPRDAVPNPVNL
ncbi:MAG: cation diffusion facilitator family transporter [Lachnospiraceae bacterium]|nr:cation diffusion facilitator family transporter [Lachnospiraceae bacterium]